MLILGGEIADEGKVELLIELRYAKGRSHQMTLTTSERLRPGSRFELFGRHWRVVEQQPGRRRTPAWDEEEVAPLVCVLDDPADNGR